MAPALSTKLRATIAALGTAALLLPAVAQASGSEPAPRLLSQGGGEGMPAHGHGQRASGLGRGHFRAVCEDRGGHCTARVVTDDSGKPLVSAHPKEVAGG